jgi:hypothetical protein
MQSKPVPAAPCLNARSDFAGIKANPKTKTPPASKMAWGNSDFGIPNNPAVLADVATLTVAVPVALLLKSTVCEFSESVDAIEQVAFGAIVVHDK